MSREGEAINIQGEGEYAPRLRRTTSQSRKLRQDSNNFGHNTPAELPLGFFLRDKFLNNGSFSGFVLFRMLRE